MLIPFVLMGVGGLSLLDNCVHKRRVNLNRILLICSHFSRPHHSGRGERDGRDEHIVYTGPDGI